MRLMKKVALKGVHCYYNLMKTAKLFWVNIASYKYVSQE